VVLAIVITLARSAIIMIVALVLITVRSVHRHPHIERRG
jgi:hypothetical protein